ncbi:MAG: hypothetical protein JW908_12370 [Anaerolineales bacterium]|nr:hypothetical protein [Anaerolineales bacterium]
MMKRIPKIIFTIMLMAILAAPFQAHASPSQSPDEARRQYWRSGFILQSSPKYSGIVGKGASLAVKMQSKLDTDVYFAFPAVASKPYVRQASYYLLSRTGAYHGNAALSLEVYNFEGIWQRTLSTSQVDLQAAALQTWVTIPLDDIVAHCQLNPGEVLTFHLALDGAAGGDLDVQPIFEVATESIIVNYFLYFFPLIVK